MRKTKKRFLSALLACAMLISLFPFAAFADSTSLPPAEDGVIKLTENVTLTSQWTINADENITIDLNGRTLTVNAPILVYGSMTIKDSSITQKPVVSDDYKTVTYESGVIQNTSNQSSSSQTINVKNNGSLIVESGSIKSDKNCGVYVTATLAPDQEPQKANFVMNGGYIEAQEYGIGVAGQNAQVTVNDGVVVARDNAAVAGNGTKTGAADHGGTVININGGTIIGHTITQGYIASGVYHPQSGQLNITGGTIYADGGVGILMRAGNANITGGQITATGDVSGKVGDSKILAGSYGVVYDEQSSYPGMTASDKVSISGSSNISANKGAVNIVTDKEKSSRINITGGIFSSNVDAYVPTGYECVSQDGKYVVQTSSKLEADAVVDGGTSNATVGGNYSGDEKDDGVDTAGGTVSIDVSNAQSSSNITTSNVTIANEALTSLNKADSVQNVEIKTDVATVTMDSAALGAMTDNADGDGVVLSVAKTDAVSNAPLTYSITAVTSADNKEVFDSNSAAGSVTISVNYTGTNPQVYYVGANGLENMNATYDSVSKTLKWTTKHFSDYVVLDGSTVATVTDNGNVTAYDSLEDAITAANGSSNNPVVDLVRDATITTIDDQSTAGIVPISKTMTINGHGNTISYIGTKNGDAPQQGGLFVIGANNVVMKDITIDVEKIKHAVQFYKTTGGELNNVTINGADWTAVQVNGAQKVALNNCVLNPNTGAYANIEYCMGSGVTTIPSMTMENVSTTGDSPAVWVDNATVTAMKGVLGTGTTNKQIQEKLLQQVTYTSNNGGSLALSVEFEKGKPGTPVYVESTYQPPYTGKYSYEITVADTDNGTVSVDKYATEGEDVTITVTPDKGYKLDELTVTAGSKDVDVKDNGNGTYTFTMPSSKVKVAATFVEDENYDDSITISMTVGSNDFVINDTIVTIPDAAPYIANSRTYVPFRALGEAIGADVVWDNDARTVTYTLDGNEIVMTIGSTTYTVNGVEKTMDVAPEITGERTYVPIRFIGEALGFKVTPLYAEDGTTASVVFEK